MNCPHCDSAETKLINTTPDNAGHYKQIQRFRCCSCDHRWYAGIPHPVVIPYVTYSGYGNTKGRRSVSVAS